MENIKLICTELGCKDKTSSTIAEIDDRPHGTGSHYILTKPRFYHFQNFLKTDRQTKSPIKTRTRRLEMFADIMPNYSLTTTLQIELR